MIRNKYERTRMLVAWLAVCTIFLMPVSVFPQTRITLHSNKYSIQDDIKLGRQAAAEAEQQFPLLRDPEVQSLRGASRQAFGGGYTSGVSASGISVLLQGYQCARY